MSNSSIEIFHANREFVPLPKGISTAADPSKLTYEEIIRYAKQKRIRFILVNHNTHESNPNFIPSIKDSDLMEIYRYQKDKEHFVIIYEVIR